MTKNIIGTSEGMGNPLLESGGLTVCVSRWWAGRDSLREQKKLEFRKTLENGDESHQSAARFVRHYFLLSTVVSPKLR
jgi:hypothetical protein